MLSGDTSEAVSDFVLLDVAPFSLGIETDGGVMTSLIKRNSTIPIKQTQTFTNDSENQSAITYKVYEGDGDMTNDNNLIGMFELTDIPPAPNGVTQIDVTFDIDANSILTVSARELRTEREISITISSSIRLSEDEIERMRNDAQKFKEEENKQRLLISAKNRFENHCFNMKSTMKNISDKYDDAIKWLDNNQLGEVEELQLQEKLREVDAACLPILMSLHQSAGGAGTSGAGGSGISGAGGAGISGAGGAAPQASSGSFKRTIQEVD